MPDISTQAPQYGDDTDNTLLYKIAIRLFGSGGAFAGLTDAQLRAAAVPVSGSTTTQVSAAKTAGQSVVIPVGAKEWTVSIWTGTATVNGAAGCPAGFSDGSDKANAATITIAFDTPGTGYVRYAT